MPTCWLPCWCLSAPERGRLGNEPHRCPGPRLTRRRQRPARTSVARSGCRCRRDRPLPLAVLRSARHGYISYGDIQAPPEGWVTGHEYSRTWLVSVVQPVRPSESFAAQPWVLRNQLVPGRRGRGEPLATNRANQQVPLEDLTDA